MSETEPPASTTTRDAVWAAALDAVATHGRVTLDDVLDAADLTERQRDTARDTLNAMVALGRLDHRRGSRYWTRPASATPAATVMRDRRASKWTFSDPEIRGWIEARLSGRVLNLCAGRSHLDHPDGEVVRNDVNAARDADTHIDAAAVADHFPPESFDTVVVDPPWGKGIEKRRPKYGGEYVDDYTRMKDGVATVLRPGGRTIIFGFDASGLGEHRGVELEEVAAIHFTGRHHDVFATVERLPRE